MSTNLRYAIRTFVVSFLALFIPGLLGWLNALTEWAKGEGSTPFPDARGLAYLGVSAIVAGVIALVNFGFRALEDGVGVGLLRDVDRSGGRHERGAVSTRTIAVVALAVVVVVVLIMVF